LIGKLMDVTERPLRGDCSSSRRQSRRDISRSIQLYVLMALAVRDCWAWRGTFHARNRRFPTSGNNVPKFAGDDLTIEPMVNASTPTVEILADGWTVVTKDGRRHFEHTVLITELSQNLNVSRKMPSKLKAG
jgi:hypothetical protein